MNALMTLLRACLVLLFAVALNACVGPYGNAGMAGYGPSSGVASAQQALLQQQGIGGVGMMPGIPFGTANRYTGSGFSPEAQPRAALEHAMVTMPIVSPNIPIFHPPQLTAATAVGTASQAAPADGYATQAQLRAVAGRVHRNAEEAARAIETLRRQRR